MEVEMKAHEFLFAGQQWHSHLTDPVDPDKVREHIMWGEISKVEWLLVKSLAKPGPKTKERVQQFTADIAAFCKKKWDCCINPHLAKLCHKVFKDAGIGAEAKKRGSSEEGDAPDKKKRKKDKKDKKDKEEGTKKDNKKDDKAAGAENKEKSKKDKKQKKLVDRSQSLGAFFVPFFL